MASPVRTRAVSVAHVARPTGSSDAAATEDARAGRGAVDGALDAGPNRLNAPTVTTSAAAPIDSHAPGAACAIAAGHQANACLVDRARVSSDVEIARLVAGWSGCGSIGSMTISRTGPRRRRICRHRRTT